MNFSPLAQRNKITTREDFFGRRQEIRHILPRIASCQSTSIVGERRAGKSSLLYQLCHFFAPDELQDGDYRFAYCDLQDARFHTVAGLLRELLRCAGLTEGQARAVIADGGTLNDRLIAFGREMEGIEQRYVRAVFFLDEFEKLFDHSAEFTNDFFDHLRSMLDRGQMAFVTASRRPLQEHCLEHRLTSPFYNIFTTCELGPLKDNEADEFIAHYRQRLGFEDGELRFIRAALHPALPLRLRIVCDLALRNRELGLSDEMLAREVNRELAQFKLPAFSPKQLRRAKRFFSLDYIRKILDVLNGVTGLLKSDKKKGD